MNPENRAHASNQVLKQDLLRMEQEHLPC
jgi:hypothetical protein